MKDIQDKLAENEYYHGTFDYKAIQILYEGFQLKKKYCDWGKDGVFRQGIYLTKSIDTAVMFAHGDIVFKCRPSDKISILRIDEKYDNKIIDSLKREFGRNILSGDISKAIPSNKHLTKKELINLLNYRFHKGFWRLKSKDKWYSEVSPSIRHQLKLHKYDAIGEPEDDCGIAVFNPSYVQPITMFHIGYKERKPFLKNIDKNKFVSDLEQTIFETRQDSDRKDEWEDMDYIESLLKKYRKENHLD